MSREYFLRLVLVISVIALASMLGFFLARFYGVFPQTEINLEEELNLTGWKRNITRPYMEPSEIRPTNVTPCLSWIRISKIVTTSENPYPKRPSGLIPPVFEGKLKSEFKQGEAIWIYFEYSYLLSLEGEVEPIGIIGESFNRHEKIYIKRNKDVVLVANIVFNLIIIDQEGEVRLKADHSSELMSYMGGGSYYSFTGERGTRFVFAGRIPFSFEPGEYKIVAMVADLLTGMRDEKAVNITVLPGEYREIRFSPISKPPETLILREDELTGGWKEIRSFSRSIWDPFYEQQIWFATKVYAREVSGIRRMMEINIMLFETPERASSYFEDMLHGFNESNPWALSEIISRVPGVRSFLYIHYERIYGLRTISVRSLIDNAIITVIGGGYLEGTPTPAPLIEEILDIAEMQELKVISSQKTLVAIRRV